MSPKDKTSKLVTCGTWTLPKDTPGHKTEPCTYTAPN